MDKDDHKRNNEEEEDLLDLEIDEDFLKMISQKKLMKTIRMKILSTLLM